MKLFDFLKLLFSNSKEYNGINNYQRGSYFFMTNRIIAIKQPVKANLFNHLEINTGQAVNSYHDMLSKVGSLPSWSYACLRSEKESNKIDKVKLKFTPKESTILEYCKVNEITYKEMDRLLKFYTDEISKELKEFEVSLEQEITRIKK